MVSKIIIRRIFILVNVNTRLLVKVNHHVT